MDSSEINRKINSALNLDKDKISYDLAVSDVQRYIPEAIRELLEKRHLYQNFDLKLEDIHSVREFSQIKGEAPFNSRLELFKNNLSNYMKNGWSVDASVQDNRLDITYLPIRTYCLTCKRNETFRFDKGFDIFIDNVAQKHYFVVSYVCQYCNTEPICFFISRNKYKLQLVGRIPMEHVDVPKEFPKSHTRFLCNAIIANNSGQTLAALSLLRIFLEQYLRESIGGSSTDKGMQQVLEEYMAKFPSDFKDRFPSPKQIYADLSSAIHEANEARELFDDTVSKLSEFFRAKELHKIP